MLSVNITTLVRRAHCAAACCVLLLTFLCSAVGCEDARTRLQRLSSSITATNAPNAPAIRGVVAQQIAKDVREKRYIVGDAIDYAQQLIEKAANDVNISQQATIFAGAVLDATSLLDDELAKGGEFELFWISVGRLAFRAAEEAHARDRVPEAMTLTLAGSQRWQNDPYWERYSDHDGLTSLLLAKNGQPQRALDRLRNRIELRGPAHDVFRALTGEK